MGFSVVVDLGGLNWKCETLAERAGDLEKPLAILGARLKRKAQDRYKAQSFPPLADSTIEKRTQKGLRTIENKLKGDVRKAFKRARLARGNSGGMLARLLTSSAVRHAAEDVQGLSSRGVQNRLAALAAFQRKHRRGLEGRVQGKALSEKQTASLSAREERAVTKAVGKPILGGLSRTLVVIVNSGSMTLRSATHEEWSRAHNDGATVGRGARLPQRETIVLEQEDIRFFVSVLKSHLLLPFEEGMHAPGY